MAVLPYRVERPRHVRKRVRVGAVCGDGVRVLLHIEERALPEAEDSLQNARLLLWHDFGLNELYRGDGRTPSGGFEYIGRMMILSCDSMRFASSASAPTRRRTQGPCFRSRFWATSLLISSL